MVMSQKSVFLAVVVLGVYEAGARADSYSPYPESRIADAMGRYYVVINRKGGPRYEDAVGPVRLTIAERRTGSPPVVSATGFVKPRLDDLAGNGRRLFYEMVNRPTVRAGDLVHGRIDFDEPPQVVLVSRTGLGVVAVGVYGGGYQTLREGFALEVVSPDGKVRNRKRLNELFGRDALASYYNGSGSVWWLGGGWIDEEAREVVVVGSRYNREREQRQIVVVGIEDGKVRKGEVKQIVNAIIKRDPGALEFALELANEMGLGETRQHLPGILSKEDLPLGARLRAAVFLASSGDKRGGKLLATTAVMAKKKQVEEERPEYDPAIASATAYAIEHLPEVLGEGALPTLREATRRYGYGVIIVRAFWDIGPKAVPTLIAMLEDHADVDSQYSGAKALGKIGSAAKPAVSALIKGLESKKMTALGDRIDVACADALGLIGPAAKAAIPALRRATSDPDESVRSSAAEALRSIDK
jgi:hypothetical protein